jgi:hypothetical protein
MPDPRAPRPALAADLAYLKAPEPDPDPTLLERMDDYYREVRGAMLYRRMGAAPAPASALDPADVLDAVERMTDDQRARLAALLREAEVEAGPAGLLVRPTAEEVRRYSARPPDPPPPPRRPDVEFVPISMNPVDVPGTWGTE